MNDSEVIQRLTSLSDTQASLALKVLDHDLFPVNTERPGSACTFNSFSLAILGENLHF